MLPLSAPAIGTVAIFQVLGTWNELMFAIALIQKQNLLPLQPELNSLVGEYSTNWSALAAALTITVVPIVIVYIALQKRVVAGLTSGALKG
jgi:ABC-type glycerol-3-phosphate transport system permease component